MVKKGKIVMSAVSKRVVRNRPIHKVGLDSGVLIALIDNDLLCLSKPKIFIKKGICFAYQLVVNQTIGVLIGRGYPKKEAISMTLRFLRENKIIIIKEKDMDLERRNQIYNELRNKRKKIKVDPKPEDSDLDILASYKAKNIDCIFTTNFKHFIELGKYLGVFIEGVYDEKNQELIRVDKMFKGLYWGRRKSKRSR